MSKNKNGFIYPIFDKIINILYYCNLVELFKYVAKLYSDYQFKEKNEQARIDNIIKNRNIAIDIYQIFKWALLIFLWTSSNNTIFAFSIICYLLSTNLYTYFYYHVWGSNYKQRIDRDTVNRKFLNTILAVTYYLFCYAYLYQIHYFDMVSWPLGVVDSYNAIYLSVANAFTLTYGGFMPLNQTIRIVFMGELITTFLFLTVIITNSIPYHTEGKGEGK